MGAMADRWPSVPPGSRAYWPRSPKGSRRAHAPPEHRPLFPSPPSHSLPCPTSLLWASQVGRVGHDRRQVAIGHARCQRQHVPTAVADAPCADTAAVAIGAQAARPHKLQRRRPVVDVARPADPLTGLALAVHAKNGGRREGWTGF
eukprot:351786-Chlamydomonas_euryale.AAC.3